MAQACDLCFGGRLFLGTSSWSFPGWRGLVWDDRGYADAELSRHGLVAYAQHPLFGTVSLDRTFYRALDADTYGRLARQVPAAFRFIVKAPAEITDATLRIPESGAPLAPNPHFLDPERALDIAVRPAVRGLGDKLGVLVFQLSPLAGPWLREPQALLDELGALWRAVVPALPAGTCAALELRDARALTPSLTEQLMAHGVRYCVGLHDRMPSMTEQLPMLRATWPGDLVCRWNLHQGLRYRQAKADWEPFDRLQAPDPETREALARAVVGTLAAGYRAFVTINNKAEGSAPLSVTELARAILRLSQSPSDNAP
ncbi:MAG TPA: DUF72 domain-containing protein [Burkholderiaceae bacterium]|nr:DUF72 domain-containing protein [Burkholderiaceae bacterium]